MIMEQESFLPSRTPSATPSNAHSTTLPEGATYPPPHRACFVCQQRAWIWAGDRSICGSGAPQHQERETWSWANSSSAKASSLMPVHRHQ
ncbi:hypothetical protein [Ktedonobacter racemifer]|uniref:Uncharacterized protein n=1 Tax=Ktedonobacter racemifer DSM 44963 TaxID=485913 RepID=D6U301_KTERA|nr:hypothetical protein [Ktedonobacter racemifer]EFH82906.1 hypothetical protein Krac_3788 [Ktedonobacter racemifer DSM 44963]